MLEEIFDKRIVVRMSSNDVYSLRAIADTYGLSVSQVVRMLLRSKETLRSLEKKCNNVPL